MIKECNHIYGMLEFTPCEIDRNELLYIPMFIKFKIHKSDKDSVKYKYCPFCGRELSNEK